MNMKSVLFNSDAITAILNGDKTTFRVPVRPQSKKAAGFYVTTRKCDGAFMGVYDYDDNEAMFENSQTPPYCQDDILWVRETWRPVSATVDLWDTGSPTAIDDGFGYQYKADNAILWRDGFAQKDDEFHTTEIRSDDKWRSSIHMPKEATRMFLRVTEITAKRLHDITAYEITKEGIWLPGCLVPEDEFARVWDASLSKRKRDKYGWANNPFVWVVSFEQCERPEVEDE